MKRSIFRLLVILLLPGLLPLSAGCAPAPTRYEATELGLFDSAVTVVGYAESREEFDAVASRIFTELRSYHTLYDIYETDPAAANLAAVNRSGGQPVAADTAILDLLDFGRQVCDLTGGTTNAALGALLSIWHRFREQVRAGDSPALPADAALQEALSHASWADVQIDRAAGTVTLADPALRFDVGAIAKGYATERVAQGLEADGITGYAINAGGNLRVLGSLPDGPPWQTAIRDPLGDGTVCDLALQGQSCVTSGSYLRFVEYDGRTYGHIVDPATGRPADRYASVSVVTRHAGWADALSTALYCLSEADGRALLGAYETASGEPAHALWIYPDGTAVRTGSFPECLS